MTLMDTGPITTSIPVARKEFALEVIDTEAKTMKFLRIAAAVLNKDRSNEREVVGGQIISLAETAGGDLATLSWAGVIRVFQLNPAELEAEKRRWSAVVGLQDEAGNNPVELQLTGNVPKMLNQRSTRPPEATGPKYGQVDPTGDPHVGGNTFAGGSGGANTAGMGGVGGPFRLNSGNPVAQVYNNYICIITIYYYFLGFSGGEGQSGPRNTKGAT